MYIIKNAFENLARNKGRNILIGLVMFAIVLSTTLALIICNTSTGIINDYKERFGAAVNIAPDMQKMMDNAQKTSDGVLDALPQISVEQHLAISKSPTLYSSEMTGYMGGKADGFKTIGDSKDIQGGNNNGTGGSGSGAKIAFLPNLRIIGGDFSDFTKGLRKIIDGKMPEKDNECVISQDLAEKNSIKVGDKIKIKSQLYDSENKGTDIDLEFTVVGIYFDSTKEYENSMMQDPMMNRRNEIITTFNTLATKQESGKNGMTVNVQYYLKDPDMLEQFKKDAYAAGLSDIFTITVDTSSYNKIIKPVVGLKSISLTFMTITLILGAVILTLMTSIAIRERKYEIGVLRAMGMKKIKIAAGLWTEIITLSVIALTLGIMIGSFTAQPVANTLLNQQTSIVQSDDNTNQGGMQFAGSNENNNIKPLSSIDTSIDATTALEIISISILIISISGLFAILKITKYEPIKILMERN